jgi:histone-lysine N-methyltransferase SETMAR
MTFLSQQRSVIRYYCLRGKTNAQIVTKLEQGYHQDALSLRAVENWAATFRAGRETVEDDEGLGRHPQNDLGDAVLRFLRKQPHSSSREISKGLYSPRTTILRVLDNLELHFFAPRWIRRRLSDAQKADRVGLSRHMLDMMQGLGPKQQRYLITGDESWIYWENQQCGMLTQDRDKRPPNVKLTISSKKTMLSAYFSRCGFVSVEFLPMRQKYNSQFVTRTVLPSIDKKLAECRQKLRTTAGHLHVDNAKPHISKMSIERIEDLDFILVPQPRYPPDLAPCDFFLFGYLKQHLEGKHFTREDQVIAAVSNVLDKIPLQTFQNVMDDWECRSRTWIQLRGEYLP